MIENFKNKKKRENERKNHPIFGAVPKGTRFFLFFPKKKPKKIRRTKATHQRRHFCLFFFLKKKQKKNKNKLTCPVYLHGA